MKVMSIIQSSCCFECDYSDNHICVVIIVIVIITCCSNNYRENH